MAAHNRLIKIFIMIKELKYFYQAICGNRTNKEKCRVAYITVLERYPLNNQKKTISHICAISIIKNANFLKDEISSIL